MGVSLGNVSLSVSLSRGKTRKETGEILFTHFGITGPMVMNLSPLIAEGMKKGKVTLSLDLVPHLEKELLEEWLLEGFQTMHGGEVRSVLREILPKAVVALVMKVSGVPEDRKTAQTAREERRSLVETIKGLSMTPEGLLGYQWAVVTRGGVSLKEVAPVSLASKKIRNLFFAGEVLDIDGPTGGFNLQACWTTGFVAGSSASGCR